MNTLLHLSFASVVICQVHLYWGYWALGGYWALDGEMTQTGCMKIKSTFSAVFNYLINWIV